MHRKLIILLSIFITNSSYSQELLNLISPEDEALLIDDKEIVLGQPLDDEELENLSTLRDREKESVEQIVNSKFNKYDERQKEIKQVQLEDILKSKIFKGYINKGVKLFNMVERKQEVLTQNIYVKAYSQTDIENYHLIQNENGTVTYKVRASEIAHIENISNLYEPPTKFKPVSEVAVYNQVDSDDFKISPELLYHSGVTRPELMRDLTNDENHTGTLTRIELRTIADFDIPVKVGLSFLYTNISAQVGSGGENYKVDSLGVGPVLQVPNLFEDLFNLNFNLSYHSSLFANVTEQRANETLNYRLSQSMIMLSLEKEIEFIIGKFLIGANFQRQWGRASSDQFNIDVDNENNYDDSYALMFGWGFNWDI